MSNVTDSLPPAGLPPTLVLALTQGYRLGGALWIMPLCLLIYDILITIDDEVKYFWHGRAGKLSTVLFFVNRYWPAANLIFHNTILSWKGPSPAVCTFWFQYTGYSAGLEHMVVGAILILRIYAMFDCNKRLLAVLLALYGVAMSSETVLIGVITHQFHSNEALRSTFTGCAPTNIPLWCWIYWVPSVAFESVLFLLALWKTVQEAQGSMTRPSRLMIVLLRDSIIYFGGVMIWSLANFVAWYVDPLPLYGMFVGCHICFQSVLGCRMLLNIRETAAVTLQLDSRAVGTLEETRIETMKFRKGYAKSEISSVSSTSTMV